MNLSTNNYITGIDYSGTNSITSSWRYDTTDGTGVIVSNDPYVWVGANGDYKQGDIRRHAPRMPKKKKGDLAGKNDQSNRLRVLSPIVIFEFSKKRFSPIQSTKLSKRLEMVAKILDDAKSAGQIALKEEIEKEFGNVLREQELIACGITQYISSYMLEKFIERCSNKIIKITPIKNYVRIIPKGILKQKEKLDEKHLFDGYVIAHTDPNNTSVKKTEAERKDPILFGILNGSERFYFIADWKDELCTLTFKDIIKAFKDEDVGPEMSLLGGDLGRRMREILEE